VNFDLATVLWLVMLIPSIVFHEYMHGYAAYRLGDPTAKDAGRLSLNPLRHIDPIGTVVLPLLLWAGGGPIFGYAKPVPINPRNFADIRRGDFITGIAGPAANLALALVGSAGAWLAYYLAATSPSAANIIFAISLALVQTNLVLMFFNLIPVPPLDGSSIIPLFLPDRALHTWYSLQRYSFVLLIGIIWLLPMVANVDPIGWYFEFTVLPLMRLLLPGG